MKENLLSIKIDKPLEIAFSFAITPPNSTLWIPGITEEETSEWPVKEGTVYRLKNSDGKWSEVTVKRFVNNRLIQWELAEGTYYCRYDFEALSPSSCRLDYREWVSKGELDGPFTQDVLDKLKLAIESSD